LNECGELLNGEGEEGYLRGSPKLNYANSLAFVLDVVSKFQYFIKSEPQLNKQHGERSSKLPVKDMNGFW
jgi:hypothetical protein